MRPIQAALLVLATVTITATTGARPAAATAAVPAARVHAFGLPAFGDLHVASAPVVGITATSSGSGYRLVAADGGVFAFGDATYHGSPSATPLSQPVVGLAPTPSGRGYWLVASDGGIFSYGDASFFGSTGGTPLNQPIIGMASTPNGNGYWLAAADGGIFAFGDAAYYGSTGDLRLNQPIAGLAATTTGRGYWLVGRDGGIFAFGDAPALGSVPGTGAVVANVVGFARSGGGSGYVVAAQDGRVWTFGDAPARGSAPLVPNRGVVGVATAATGYWLSDIELPLAASVPPLPPGSGDGRRVVYCNSCQRVWFVEANGAAVRSHLVSGRVATPRAGTYAVFSKSRLAHSASPGVSMEYMVRFAQGRGLPIGFHAIPRKGGRPIQTEAQLGTFRSLGCVRQADRDALATWDFASVGTRVVVTP